MANWYIYHLTYRRLEKEGFFKCSQILIILCKIKLTVWTTYTVALYPDPTVWEGISAPPAMIHSALRCLQCFQTVLLVLLRSEFFFLLFYLFILFTMEQVLHIFIQLFSNYVVNKSLLDLIGQKPKTSWPYSGFIVWQLCSRHRYNLHASQTDLS